MKVRDQYRDQDGRICLPLGRIVVTRLAGGNEGRYFVGQVNQLGGVCDDCNILDEEFIREERPGSGGEDVQKG